MSSDPPSRGERPKRKKTELACDTCRQRKSRCDGRRPTCSHCEALGLQCVYRPTMTSLEADASVLTRLAEIEARLQAIDQSQSDSGSVFSPKESSSVGLPRMPDLHTAAAHKMMQYWPRLRLKMDIPRLEPLQYLRLVDDADEFFYHLHAELSKDYTIPLSRITTALENLYDQLDQLPFVFQYLFQLCSQFSQPFIAKSLTNHQSGSPGSKMMDIRQQSPEELLVQTVAFKYLASQRSDKSWNHKANICFSQALQWMWHIASRSEVQIIGTKLMFIIIMLYCYGRPFHAFGWLKALEVPIMSAVLQSNDQESNRSLEASYKRLYYLLESDILTEIDGSPSRTLPASPVQTRSSFSVTESLASPATQPSPKSPLPEDQMQVFLKLRGYLNQILEAVYTMDKAYCQPHDIGAVVNEISRELDVWYYNLPQELQFPRSPSIFGMVGSPSNSTMDEVMLRYFACLFLLNRPNLYFLLHEDMEQAATPPDKSQPTRRDPWVFESFRVCVQNAILIILFHRKKYPNTNYAYFHGWCDMQLLIAAYSVLLLVQNTSNMDVFLREAGNVNELLDLAEAILEKSPTSSANVKKTLEVLRNVRHNFRRQTQVIR